MTADKLKLARECFERLVPFNSRMLSGDPVPVDKSITMQAYLEGYDKRGEVDAERIETLQLQLAGCGVAALCNTEKSISGNRISPDNPYWSASYGDVCRAVDREIELRTQAAKDAAVIAELRTEIENLKLAHQEEWAQRMKL